MSNPTIPHREVAAGLDPADAQNIAEVSLGLRNLSYTITDFLSGQRKSALENLPDALFTLHCQVLDLSARLDELAANDAAALPETVVKAQVKDG